MAKLSLLEPDVYTLKLEQANGEEEEIRLAQLSFYEQRKISNAVQNPEVPTIVNKAGEKVAQPDDPDYLEEVADAMIERRLRIVATSLQRGGSFEELNDMTLEEAAEAVGRMSEDKVNVIWSYIHAWSQAGQVRITAIADRFQNGHVGSEADAGKKDVPAATK